MFTFDSINPYYAVALIAFLEAAGAPLPSAPLLMAAGAFAATHDVSLFPLVMSAGLGAVLTDAVWFEVGRKRGLSLVRLYCTASLSSAQCSSRTEQFFRRMGPRALLISKFVPGLAAMAAPMAGLIGVRRRLFWLLDASGALVWSTTLIGAGYLAGPGLLEWVAPHASRVGSVVTWAVLLAIVTLFGVRLWRRRRFGPPRDINPVSQQGETALLSASASAKPVRTGEAQAAKV